MTTNGHSNIRPLPPMNTSSEPSVAKKFRDAIHNRRQAVRTGLTGDGIVIRQISPSLYYVANKYAATFASGRRAVGRAVRFVRAAR